MKRPEFDRFIADPSDREEEGSAEVHLIVTDAGHRAVSIRWRYLALAAAIFGAAAAILVTSLKSGDGRAGSSSASLVSVPRSARPTQVGALASPSGSSCVDAGGYGGFGARVSSFDPNNNDSTDPAGPSPGTAFYVVTATEKGCVTGFAVEDSTTPPLTARDLLVLVSHALLPGDANQVMHSDSCAVWRSRALTRATGRAYARATAIAGSGSVPGTAEISASSNSAC